MNKTYLEDAKKSVSWVTLNKILVSVFALIQVVILTRFLDKSDFGLVSMALVVVNLSNVFVEMGLTSALLHHQNATIKQYSSIFWLNIFISVAFYLLTFLIAPYASYFYSDIRLTDLIRVLGVNLLFVALGKQYRTLLQKEFQFKSIFIGEIISVVLGLITAITLAYWGYGVYSLVFSTLVKSLVASLIFFMFGFRNNPIRFLFSFDSTKVFLRVGGFSMGTSLLDYFSREFDILIIGKVLGAEIVGIYSLAKQLVMRVYALVNPIITSILSPYLSKIQDQHQVLSRTYLKVIRYIALLNFPIYMLLAVCSEEVLVILYGKEYADGSIVLTFLSLAYALQTIGNPVGSLQIATGRTDLGFVWTIFRVIATPFIIYISSFGGMNYVAFGFFVLCLLFQYPAWKIMISRMIDGNFSSYLTTYLFVYITMLVTSSLIYILFHSFSLSLFLFMIVKILLALLIYSFMSVFFDKNSLNDYKKLFNILYRK